MNPELVFEMAEVYELALIRDRPLNALDYAAAGFPGRPRKVGENGQLIAQTLFRGSSPGVEVGPIRLVAGLVGTNAENDFNTLHPNMRYNIVDVPEPSAIALLGIGLLGFAFAGRRAGAPRID